jgi:hypothetical protein
VQFTHNTKELDPPHFITLHSLKPQLRDRTDIAEVDEEKRSCKMSPTTTESPHFTLFIVCSNSKTEDWSIIPIISDPLIENNVRAEGTWVISVVGIWSLINTSRSPQRPRTFSFLTPKSQYVNWSLEETERVEGNTSITFPHKLNGEIEGTIEIEHDGFCDQIGEIVGEKESDDRGVTGTRLGEGGGSLVGRQEGKNVGTEEGRVVG